MVKRVETEKNWPEGKQCCVCVSFDVDAEWVFMGNKPETANMPRRISLGRYEWDTECFSRILDVLDEYQIRATFFIVGINAANHPDVMKRIQSRGHELAIHGWKHENIADLPKEEEGKRILMTVKAIEDAVGVRPVGNRTAGGELSPHTLDLLWENGFLYDSSLRGSDLPYRLKRPGSNTEKGLVIVPSYYEMDDFHLFADYPGIPAYHARMLSPQTGYEIWTNAFDGYYKFGLCYTTMFHPQVIGKPGSIMLLDRLFAYMRKFPNVWYATAKEIAQHWVKKEDSNNQIPISK
jgi:peptidoglycan/xylan/chitin deacetylase (PgdA/CDA1 family)